MKRYFKILLLGGLLLLLIGFIVKRCINKTCSKEIWEYRTERYLDRVATNAVIMFNDAKQRYEDALKQKKEIDTVALHDTINMFEPQYLDTKSFRDSILQLIWKAQETMSHEDPIYKKYVAIYKQTLSVTEPYERALEKLELARGKGVKEAKEALTKADHNLDVILYYMNLKNTKANRATLRTIYDFCEDAERHGWYDNMSSRFVEYMEKLEDQ